MKKAMTIVAMAIAAVAAAVPATAQDHYDGSRYDSVNRASDYGRRGVGQVYRYAGTRACGYGCGRAAQEGGYRIYDGSRNWAHRNGERLQDVGRRARERFDDRRRRR